MLFHNHIKISKNKWRKRQKYSKMLMVFGKIFSNLTLFFINFKIKKYIFKKDFIIYF